MLRRGYFSKPLTKQEAKLFQKQVQEQGTSIKIDYNTFQTKELALHIGQNAGLVGLQSAALAAGMSAVASLASGDGIDGDALIRNGPGYWSRRRDQGCRSWCLKGRSGKKA